MKKQIKFITLILIGIMIGMSIKSISFTEKGIFAVKSKFKIFVNSEQVNMKTYDINGETYINFDDLQYYKSDLPIYVETNYKNKTINMIPLTYISFRDFDGNKFVNMNYYIDRYTFHEPIVKQYPENIIAPPTNNYNLVNFWNLKNDYDNLLKINIENSNGKKLYSTDIKIYNNDYSYLYFMRYKDFVNNSKILLNAISDNEKSIEDKEKHL